MSRKRLFGRTASCVSAKVRAAPDQRLEDRPLALAESGPVLADRASPRRLWRRSGAYSRGATAGACEPIERVEEVS